MLRKKWFFIIVTVLFLTTAIGFTVNASDLWTNLGGSYKKNYSDKEKNKIVAKVGDEIVTKQEVEGVKTFASIQGKRLSSEEISNEVFQNKIMVIEAKKLGLFPSKAETTAYMKELKNAIEQNSKAINKESEDSWKKVLTGLGMTNEQFWQSEETFKGYQQELAIAKLRAKLAQDWGFSEEQFKTLQGVSDFEKKIGDMVQTNKNNVKFEILVNDVFQAS